MRYGDAVSGSKKHFFESFPNLCLTSSAFLRKVEFLMFQFFDVFFDTFFDTFFDISAFAGFYIVGGCRLLVGGWRRVPDR